MKRPLYIIHGWTYTLEHWQTCLGLLKDAGIPVKMLQVPGLTAKSSRVFTIDDYVSWANREIPTGAIALGHSNGGRILLNLLSRKPTKLSHLILLDSAGIYEPSKKTSALRKLAQKASFLKKSRLLTKVFHKLIGASDYDHAPANMKQTLENMLTSDKSLNLDPIATPTTIIWGREDRVTPLSQAQTLNAKLKNSRLEIYPKWGHSPYSSHPAELAKAIQKAYEEATR